MVPQPPNLTADAEAQLPLMPTRNPTNTELTPTLDGEQMDHQH